MSKWKDNIETVKYYSINYVFLFDPRKPYRPNRPGDPIPRPEWDFDEEDDEYAGKVHSI